MVEALVADARKALRITSDHVRHETHGLQLRVRGLEPEELEDAEYEAAAGLEMRRRVSDHAIEERPAVRPAVVRRRLRIVTIAAGWRRHLRRIRADDVEALARDGRPPVTEARVD